MSHISTWVRTARAIEFGRHIPLTKLVRRIELDARRMWRDRWPAASNSAAPSGVQHRVSRKPAPPLSPFVWRSGAITLVGEGSMHVTFLGRREKLSMPGIDWNTPGGEPEHQLWRMNLHYMEYLREVPDSLWAALIKDWITANPPHRRGAWKDRWNSYALSQRTVIWMQELARRAGRLDAGVVRAAEASLIQQIKFLANNLETDLGGNHLIKNIRALAWASAFFEGAAAERWREIAVDLLAGELPRQILADGMHYERSPSYHAQVFADLLECRLALGLDVLGGALDDALHRMAQVTADLAHPDGKVALFNDAGLTMASAPAECLDVYERLFRKRPAPRCVFALDRAGYFGLRTAESYLVADCGRIAPDDLPAHGHGDVLSFEWSVAGERIIVDQGVYEYVAGPKRQAARAAASHNTLTLVGADQADFFGAFRCGRRPNVEVRRFEPRLDGFVLEGSHDGFAYLPGRPIHVRRFEAAPNRLTICDRIEGTTDRTVCLSFLLHPEVAVEMQGERALLTRGAAYIELTAPSGIVCEPAVWWPDMGHEFATRRLRVAVSRPDGDIVTKLEARRR